MDGHTIYGKLSNSQQVMYRLSTWSKYGNYQRLHYSIHQLPNGTCEHALMVHSYRPLAWKDRNKGYCITSERNDHRGRYLLMLWWRMHLLGSIQRLLRCLLNTLQPLSSRSLS